ncbi:MAG: hypothetical protein Q8928_18425 [Bacteroidota bacterium]|nr:hypothetical protein [Bacteroidota bacterium]
MIIDSKFPMTKELIFKTDLPFDSVIYDKDSDSWRFCFKSIDILTSGFWRILKDGCIYSISSDHGHQFGLSKPVDLESLLNTELVNRELKELRIKECTGDLLLSLTDDCKIEIFISSTGYETYEFSINNKRYIGLGSGEIGIYDEK